VSFTSVVVNQNFESKSTIMKRENTIRTGLSMLFLAGGVFCASAESETIRATHDLSRTGTVSVEKVNGKMTVTTWDGEWIDHEQADIFGDRRFRGPEGARNDRGGRASGRSVHGQREHSNLEDRRGEGVVGPAPDRIGTELMTSEL